MSFTKKAEEIGGQVGAVAAVAAVAPILGGIAMVENAFRQDAAYPVTSSVVETAIKIGSAVGKFTGREGPNLAIRMMIGDVLGIVLPLSGKDDYSCE